MIKIEVTKNRISLTGHAMYDDYGKDIVCAAASSTVITSIESIAAFDKDAVDIVNEKDKLEIVIKKHDDITNKLLDTMLLLLNELVKKYPNNIKIINKEE